MTIRHNGRVREWFAHGWCRRCDIKLERCDQNAKKIVFLICPACSAHCEPLSFSEYPLSGFVPARAVWSTPKHRRG